MLVVIDGVDCTGKTTLAQRVAARGAMYVHKGPPESHPLEEYVAGLLAYRPATDSVVLDRWAWGEMVWPSIFGRETCFDEEMLRYTEMFLDSRGAVLVYATGTQEGVKRRMADRGEDKLAVADLRAAMRGYDRIHRATSLVSVFQHNLDVKHPGDGTKLWATGVDVDLLVGMARDCARQSARVLGATTEYVGPLMPEVLLVGDERNHRAAWATWGLPFVPMPQSCGHWLMTALEARELVGAGLTNSTTAVAPLWEELGRPKLVALGRLSDRRLTDLGLDHGTAPHPQSFRRFHHHYSERYVDALIDASDGNDTTNVGRELSARWR